MVPVRCSMHDVILTSSDELDAHDVVHVREAREARASAILQDRADLTADRATSWAKEIVARGRFPWEGKAVAS